MAKFILTVSSVSMGQWNEDYNKNDITTVEEATKWGRDIIEQYNEEEVRRYGEKARLRTFVSATIVDSAGTGQWEHEWRKVNSFTLRTPQGRIYDAHECKHCEVKARRYGLSETYKRDPKWKAKKYEHCQRTK